MQLLPINFTGVLASCTRLLTEILPGVKTWLGPKIRAQCGERVGYDARFTHKFLGFGEEFFSILSSVTICDDGDTMNNRTKNENNNNQPWGILSNAHSCSQIRGMVSF